MGKICKFGHVEKLLIHVTSDGIFPENFQISSEVISLKHLKRRDSTTAQAPNSNHHPRTHFYTEILAAREIV